MKLSLIYIAAFTTIYYSCLVLALPLNEKRFASSCLSNAKFTKYWIPKEGEQDATNDGRSVFLDIGNSRALKTASGETIAMVSDITYSKFQMEGTGLLSSGVMVNLGINKNVFVKLDRSVSPYGLGSEDHINLDPWVSIASNELELGTTLYIKELDGITLPNGRVHNGCVRVDDKGWGLEYCQLDFFVLQFSAYKDIARQLPSAVTATQQSCNIQNYITSSVQRWAIL